jgi:predicted GIY-YIG superfamily endonuclease
MIRGSEEERYSPKPQMYFVYILHSLKEADRYYVGYTIDLEHRLEEHNSGKSAHTKPWMPWEFATYVAFKSKNKAKELEKYLKSGSGHAFFRKCLI